MFFSRKKKWFSISLVLLISFSIIVSGCGASIQDNSNSAPQYAGDGNVEFDYLVATESEEKASYTSQNQISFGMKEVSNPALSNQMMIYSGSFSIEVDDIEEAGNIITQAVNNTQGYLISSNKNENNERIYAHYEFRIPVKGFDSIVSEIENMDLGKIKSQNTNGIDVTEEYTDLESRLKAKRAYEERLLDFINRAEKTEELLKISNDLNRVQEEIERILGRQQYLEHHTSYSTLVIELSQYKDKSAPSASTWEKAVDGFKKSIQFVIDFFESAFIILITFIPILVVLGLVGVVVIWVIRKRVKAKKKLNEHNDIE